MEKYDDELTEKSHEKVLCQLARSDKNGWTKKLMRQLLSELKRSPESSEREKALRYLKADMTGRQEEKCDLL